MDIMKILEDIGLTKNEIKVYLSLLELGSTTTGPLIKKTGIHTSKVYDALERLGEKGLVSYVMISKFKHYKAVDPDRILDYLNEKRKTIDEEEKEIKKILPELQLKKKYADDDTEAEIFKGWKGMDTAFKLLRESLKKNDVNYVFGVAKAEDIERAGLFFSRHLREMAKKGVKQKIIYNEDMRGKIGDTAKYPKLFKARFLLNTTPAEINVGGDKVLIVMLTGKPTVVMMSDPKVADSFRKYFEVMWEMAKV